MDAEDSETETSAKAIGIYDVAPSLKFTRVFAAGQARRKGNTMKRDLVGVDRFAMGLTACLSRSTHVRIRRIVHV